MARRKKEERPGICWHCDRPMPSTFNRKVTVGADVVTVHVTCSDEMVREGLAKHVDNRQQVRP